MRLTPATRARLQAMLACLGTLVLWWRFPARLTLSLLIMVGVFALLAWFSPRAYAPVQRAFDAVTHGILAVLSWTLLGLVYFGLFTPLRLWRGLVHQDPLHLRAAERDEPATFLQPSAPAPRFDRQF
jgi:hypothetical protein